jgi:hypothetical protein
MGDQPRVFGRCCDDLRQAMHPGKNSMFNVENGMLFLNIAIVPMQSASGWFMKPVRFCPFCGTELQSTEAIEVWGSKA